MTFPNFDPYIDRVLSFPQLSKIVFAPLKKKGFFAPIKFDIFSLENFDLLLKVKMCEQVVEKWDFLVGIDFVMKF